MSMNSSPPQTSQAIASAFRRFGIRHLFEKRTWRLWMAGIWPVDDVWIPFISRLITRCVGFETPLEIASARPDEPAGERAGGDAFQQYMLPHAALRLKQGFGRLIRSRSDRGAVLLLDDRIVAKRYGRYLRDSLPDAPFIKGACLFIKFFKYER